MNFLLRLGRTCDRVVTSLGRLGSWAILGLVAVTLFDVITRRFFVLGSTKLQEMEWHLHTILMMFVFGFALLKDTHVRVDLFRERFSARTKAGVELAGNIFFLMPFCLLVLYFGFAFVESSYVMGESSASMTGLSHRWIIKSTLLLGLLLVVLAGISSSIRSLVFLLDFPIPEEQSTKAARKAGP